MYILDKNHDFYDHFTKIYGEDKSLTFDRRGSHILSDDDIIRMSYRYHIPSKKEKEFVLLEIGNKQYLIQLTNFIVEENSVFPSEIEDCDMSIVRVFEDHKHYYNSPISIRGCDVDYHWHWGRGFDRGYKFDESFKEAISKVYDNNINLPILKKTKLTSLLDPQQVWIDLQTYFSSLGNDKDISTPMTDVERAEIHGFDKKTSFRHPIR
jgi:hypothetical protein